MKANDPVKRLEDRLHRFEEHQREQSQRLRQLEKSLEQRERARQEIYEIVAQDHSNGKAREHLDAADNDIAELQRELRQFHQRTRKNLQAMRKRLLQLQDEILEEIEQDIHAKSDRLVELKKQLIPETEERLAELHEEATRSDADIQERHRQIQKINRMKMDALYEE